MCSTCGCGQPDHDHDHDHDHEHDVELEHRHEPGAGRDEDLGLAHDHGAGHSHDGARERTVLKVGRAILAENDRFAAYNRGWFDARGVRCVNLVGAPGSGKTTLLERLIPALKERGLATMVVEGDQVTDNDARRIERAGARAVQITTGKACHLDAHQVGHAAQDLDPAKGTVLFVENVGNLVCPTEFDLGEAERVVVLSCVEGSDKPAKYAPIFESATAVVLSKTDLLPYVDFDLAECRRLIAGLNAKARIFELSARTGEGLAPFVEWIARI